MFKIDKNESTSKNVQNLIHYLNNKHDIIDIKKRHNEGGYEDEYIKNTDEQNCKNDTGKNQ